MFTIIPVKPFAQAKTRLAPILATEERTRLSRFLLKRTITLARQVGEVVVISRDNVVRRVAKSAGAWALVESGVGLNQALSQAVEWVILRGGKAILIVPNDLPLLTVGDLRELINLDRTTPKMVVAPCHRREGTNALFLQPPNLIPFAFGPASFSQHQRLARAVGVQPIIYESPTVALDLDVPDDLIYAKTLSSLADQWPGVLCGQGE